MVNKLKKNKKNWPLETPINRVLLYLKNTWPPPIIMKSPVLQFSPDSLAS